MGVLSNLKSSTLGLTVGLFCIALLLMWSFSHIVVRIEQRVEFVPSPPTSEAFDRALNAGTVEAFLEEYMEDPSIVHQAHLTRGSLLTLAASRGDLEFVDALLEKGTNPNWGGYSSLDNPLQCAVRNGHFDVAEVLFRAGADPDADAGGLATCRQYAPEFFDRLEREMEALESQSP